MVSAHFTVQTFSGGAQVSGGGPAIPPARIAAEFIIGDDCPKNIAQQVRLFMQSVPTESSSYRGNTTCDGRLHLTQGTWRFISVTPYDESLLTFNSPVVRTELHKHRNFWLKAARFFFDRTGFLVMNKWMVRGYVSYNLELHPLGLVDEVRAVFDERNELRKLLADSMREVHQLMKRPK